MRDYVIRMLSCAPLANDRTQMLAKRYIEAVDELTRLRLSSGGFTETVEDGKGNVRIAIVDRAGFDHNKAEIVRASDLVHKYDQAIDAIEALTLESSTSLAYHLPSLSTVKHDARMATMKSQMAILSLPKNRGIPDDIALAGSPGHQAVVKLWNNQVAQAEAAIAKWSPIIKAVNEILTGVGC